MCNNEGARDTGEAYVVSTTPDVCMTGSSPVPYTIVSYLDTAVRAVDTVRMTSLPSLTMDSRLAVVTGDEAGTGGGVSSGVNVGYCAPITHAATVRARGQNVLFHSSEFWMNCPGPEGPGNTKGRLHYIKHARYVHVDEDGQIVGETDPPLVLESEAEVAQLGSTPSLADSPPTSSVPGSSARDGSAPPLTPVAAFTGNAAPKLFPIEPAIEAPKLYLVPPPPAPVSPPPTLLGRAVATAAAAGPFVLGGAVLVLGIFWPSTAHGPTMPYQQKEPAKDTKPEPEGVRVTRGDATSDEEDKKCPPHNYELVRGQSVEQRDRLLKKLRKGNDGDRYVACLADRNIESGKDVRVNLKFLCKKCKGVIEGGQGDFDLVVDGQPYEAKSGSAFGPVDDIYRQLWAIAAASIQIYQKFPHVACKDPTLASEYEKFSKFVPKDGKEYRPIIEYKPCP